jgi:CBS domain-containing protein
MKVRDIMTTPAPSVAPDTRVSEIARAMLADQTLCLAVVDSDGSLLGAVTQTDLVAKHARVHVPRYLGFLGGVIPLETHRGEEGLRRILAVTAADLLSEDVPSVAPDTEIDDAATLLVDERAEALFVIENDDLVGLLTKAHIIRLLVLEEADDNSSVRT